MPDADERSEHDLRVELSRVVAELAAIPTDRFPERAPLLRRRDELAAELRAMTPADTETLARWADRAGAKDEGDGTEPYIESRIDM